MFRRHIYLLQLAPNLICYGQWGHSMEIRYINETNEMGHFSLKNNVWQWNEVSWSQKTRVLVLDAVLNCCVILYKSLHLSRDLFLHLWKMVMGKTVCEVVESIVYHLFPASSALEIPRFNETGEGRTTWSLMIWWCTWGLFSSSLFLSLAWHLV